MGQRTQLLVTAETPATEYSSARRHRIGRHHHWRYGPHMAICAAQVLDHLNGVVADRYYRPSSARAEGVAAIYGVNRASDEASGLSLHDDVSTANAAECDNNNGFFLVNLTPAGYTFGFLNRDESDAVTGIDGLMQEYGQDWTEGPTQEQSTEEQRWSQTLADAVATLRVGEAMGFLMDKDTAGRVTAATVAGMQTATVWDTIRT